MAFSTLSITRSVNSTSATSENIFITLEEQDPASDTATAEEAAALIDATYDIDPCDDSLEVLENAELDENGNIIVDEGPTDEDLEAAAQDVFDLALCDEVIDGGAFSIIKVYQSTPGNAYTLRLSAGRHDEIITDVESISETMEVTTATSTTLKAAPEGTGSFTWLSCSLSDEPAISASGNTLSWDNECTGTISATYSATVDTFTVYAPSEILIQVFGQSCYDSINVTPEVSEDTEALIELQSKYCKEGVMSSVPGEGDEVAEVKTVNRTTYKCQCSNKISYVETDPIDPNVPFYWPEYVDVFGGYIDCGETTGDINDPEFYKENCCKYPEFELPKCRTQYSVNAGGKTLDDATKQEYIDNFSGKTVFVAVSPDDGNCGALITHQNLHPKACCDEVLADLEWVPDVAPETLPAGRSCILSARYGMDWELYTWTTSNSETYFVNVKDTIEAGGSVQLFATKDFCGCTTVTVTDGCTEITQTVRSDVGRWEEIGWDYDFARDMFQGADYDEPETYIAADKYAVVAIIGRYKLIEVVEQSAWPAYSNVWYPYTDESDVGSCPQDGSWLNNIEETLTRGFRTLYRFIDEDDLKSAPIIKGSPDWYIDNLDSLEPENPQNPSCLASLRSIYRSSIREAVSFSSEDYHKRYRFELYPWLEDVTFYSVNAHVLYHTEDRSSSYENRKSRLYKWVC